jgi:hypothetical protein
VSALAVFALFRSRARRPKKTRRKKPGRKKSKTPRAKEKNRLFLFFRTTLKTRLEPKASQVIRNSKVQRQRETNIGADTKGKPEGDRGERYRRRNGGKRQRGTDRGEEIEGRNIGGEMEKTRQSRKDKDRGR